MLAYLRRNRGEAVVHPEHIVHHEHLAVGTTAGSDTDYRYGERRGHLPGQFRRNFLKNYGKAAYLLEHPGVGHELSASSFSRALTLYVPNLFML